MCYLPCAHAIVEAANGGAGTYTYMKWLDYRQLTLSGLIMPGMYVFQARPRPRHTQDLLIEDR